MIRVCNWFRRYDLGAPATLLYLHLFNKALRYLTDMARSVRCDNSSANQWLCICRCLPLGAGCCCRALGCRLHGWYNKVIYGSCSKHLKQVSRPLTILTDPLLDTLWTYCLLWLCVWHTASISAVVPLVFTANNFIIRFVSLRVHTSWNFMSFFHCICGKVASVSQSLNLSKKLI